MRAGLLTQSIVARRRRPATSIDDGRFEVINIVYVVQGHTFAQWETWRLRVKVTDPCGREGTATIQGFPL